jgi:RNA 3'-terminal phosphate cyclase (ATP)
MTMLHIDGSHGEGGGQLLRTAVALAAVTGRATTIDNIRAGRTKPGLAAQHVAAVRAVAELCGAKVEGLALRAPRIVFAPGALRGGAFDIDVGTAGSMVLVIQALLPAALAAGAECRVAVRGGTDVRGAPPLDYARHVFLPLVARMGVDTRLEVLRRGYFPHGGGSLELRVAPSELRALRIAERGELREIGGLAHVARLPLSVAERMRDAALRELGARAARSHIGAVLLGEGEALGTGGAVMVWARSDATVLGAGRAAERGVPAEVLGAAAGRSLADDLDAGVTVDVHAADQLLVYLALAPGESDFTTRSLSSHARTAIWLIEQFLPVRFAVDAVERGVRVRTIRA